MKYQEYLNQLDQGSKELQSSTPGVMEKFWSFAEKVKEGGNLSGKEKALIALSAAAVKHCESCMVRNLQDALDAGITKAELAELCNIVMLLDGGPGFASSSFLMEKFEQMV